MPTRWLSGTITTAGTYTSEHDVILLWVEFFQ